MILATSCMLNGSPGPNPGAPLKSPIVSVTIPLPPTDPAPDARFLRLNTLYISARSCTRNRSVIGKFLITEKSRSLKFGPTYLFRDTSPAGDNPTHLGSTGVAVELQKTPALTHCAPPAAAEKV